MKSYWNRNKLEKFYSLGLPTQDVFRSNHGEISFKTGGNQIGAGKNFKNSAVWDYPHMIYPGPIMVILPIKQDEIRLEQE